MDVDRAALMRLFLSDSEDELARFEADVLVLEERPDDLSTVDALFRTAHTLKGNAAILALDHLAKWAHSLEDMLDAVRTRRTAVTGALVSLLLRSVDALRGMLASLRSGEPDNPVRYGGLQDELIAWIATAKNDAAPVEIDEAAARSGPEAATPAPAGESRWGPALRIEMAKIDQLLDLASRALVVQGQIGAGLLQDGAANADLQELHQKSERLLMEVQDWVIDTRMIPVSMFFRAHARTVRDAAEGQRKRVRLELEGERVRIDTGIGESARDVLTHLVRNAVDHGIELPSVRAARGKNPEGTVTLRASQNGNQVVIQVSDDGAGLNLSRIRARARQLGRSDADNMSVAELHQLIFAPGFSTAEKVTELSGRGVGMDVVRRRVEDLHGTVELDSTEGVGTTVELRLPLSLSVIEGFWVEVAGTDYVLPLDDVIECIELPPEQRDRTEGESIVDLRGEPLAYVNLRDLLATGRKARPVERIVVVRYRGRHVGLGVDAIHGERQTVIKPLGRLFRSVPGISGSTLRADGAVAFVVDVARLLRSVARPGVGAGG
ncbi:MAG TPA: chemotaxis protein CheA, partial [Polyangia bacterium]|nr:chemotaxis protein CheA [Polyangia bacterium]